MSFVLVSTLEKKRLCFVVVPKAWVNGESTLFWTPKKFLRWEIEKLRSDPNSIPEFDWLAQNCVIKLRNLKTFDYGLELEKAFVNFTDTESEEK